MLPVYKKELDTWRLAAFFLLITLNQYNNATDEVWESLLTISMPDQFLDFVCQESTHCALFMV